MKSRCWLTGVKNGNEFEERIGRQQNRSEILASRFSLNGVHVLSSEIHAIHHLLFEVKISGTLPERVGHSTDAPT